MTNTPNVRRPVRLAGALAMVGLLALNGCDSLDVENLNGVSVDQLQTNPTPTAVKTAAQGLMTTWRTVTRGQANLLTKYGYEVWQIRSSSPPSLTGIVLFPNTGAFWSYTPVTAATAFLKAVDVVADRVADPVSGYTDGQKESLRGWGKTILAAALEDMAQAHDTFGIVLDLPAQPLTDVPPLATKAQVWARIFQLLDQADTHLANAATAGTTAFPFTLGPGYAGFNTPANFRRVNRALKARYQVLYGDYAGAVTSIGASFINTTGLNRAALLAGPFHAYTTQTNDQTNDLSGTDYYYNTRLRTEAQLKTPGGAPDDRLALKSRTVTTFTFLGVTSNLKHTDFYNTSLTAPTALSTTTSLPIIRNEELILLRAEANLACTSTTPSAAVTCAGGPAQRLAALNDINLIRTVSGGLPAIAVDPGQGGTFTGDLLLDELIYNKRYSLWGEFGTVWLDMRHYSRTNQIPPYDPTFRRFDIFPLPQSECEVRGYATKGCFQGGYNGI